MNVKFFHWISTLLSAGKCLDWCEPQLVLWPTEQWHNGCPGIPVHTACSLYSWTQLWNFVPSLAHLNTFLDKIFYVLVVLWPMTDMHNQRCLKLNIINALSLLYILQRQRASIHLMLIFKCCCSYLISELLEIIHNADNNV